MLGQSEHPDYLAGVGSVRMEVLILLGKRKGEALICTLYPHSEIQEWQVQPEQGL
jgi:hypothetical protein